MKSLDWPVRGLCQNIHVHISLKCGKVNTGAEETVYMEDLAVLEKAQPKEIDPWKRNCNFLFHVLLHDDDDDRGHELSAPSPSFIDHQHNEMW